jgi:hypothetical protein
MAHHASGDWAARAYRGGGERTDEPGSHAPWCPCRRRRGRRGEALIVHGACGGGDQDPACPRRWYHVTLRPIIRYCTKHMQHAWTGSFKAIESVSVRAHNRAGGYMRVRASDRAARPFCTPLIASERESADPQTACRVARAQTHRLLAACVQRSGNATKAKNDVSG